MPKMHAPDTMASITIAGETFKANQDGSIDLPGWALSDARCHGYSDWVEPVEDEGDDEFSDMKRNDLFAYLKERGVRAKTPIDYPTLRKMAREAKIKSPPTPIEAPAPVAEPPEEAEEAQDPDAAQPPANGPPPEAPQATPEPAPATAIPDVV